MTDRRTACTTAGWRRWLLALTLCLFAFGYGAPTSLPAHATTAHAAMDAGCPEAGGQGSDGAAKAVSAACCIAQCLPAMPAPLTAGEEGRPAERSDPPPSDATGEGWAAPVLLPPPRA